MTGTAKHDGSPRLTTSERVSYFSIVVLLPLLGSTLAVNGAAAFQIIAIEELGLTSRQVGLAVGLGAISIPFQIWATRVPLRLAHRNLRVYIVAMAAMCLLMAWLIAGAGSTTVVVASVLAIAILAELAVSVLFATSFQPLLATTVDAQFRQRLNAQGRAAGGLLAIGFVIVVGWASTTGRVAILLGLAGLGMVLLPATWKLRRPTIGPVDAANPQGRVATDTNLRWIFVAIGISVIPAWPFFVTYAADVFWPTANLGLIGAALAAGGLAAAALWKPTVDGLLSRARIGAVVLLCCALVFVPLRSPLEGAISELVAYAALIAATASGTIVRMSLLEMAHARVDVSTSVAVLTRLDVIASTCMQLGFLGAGFLIDFSNESQWIADPFQLSLIAGGVLLVAATTQIRD